MRTLDVFADGAWTRLTKVPNVAKVNRRSRLVSSSPVPKRAAKAGPRGTSPSASVRRTIVSVGATAIRLDAGTVLPQRDWLEIQNLHPELPSVRAQGTSAAPAAGAVVADTGALAAGDYEFVVAIGSDDTAAAGKFIAIEHRNAGNSANIRRILRAVPGDDTFRLAITIAANERLRVVTGAIAAAATSYDGYIEGKRIAYVWIGDAGVTVATGHRLRPGERWRTNVLAAVYGITDQAAINAVAIEVGS